MIATRRAIFLPLMRVSNWKGTLLLLLVAAGALTAAFVGGLLSGANGATGGVNGFVEALSGDSSSFLGNIGFLAPLGFAFAAGMVSTVNPCGFAMLPAYLGLYLGSHDSQQRRHPIRRLGRAVMVGATVTTGFILLFGIVGVTIGLGARSVVQIIP